MRLRRRHREVEYREALRIDSAWENELTFLYFKKNGLGRKLPEASGGEIVAIAWWDEGNEGLCGRYICNFSYSNPPENKK